MRAGCIRWIARRWAGWQEFGLYQHRNYGACAQAKHLMAQDAKNAADFARVRGYGDPGMIVSTEDGVQNFLRSCVLCIVRLARDPIPELVVLGQAWIDVVVWKEIVDVCPVAPPVARVDIDTFSEKLSDGWDEWVVLGQR